MDNEWLPRCANATVTMTWLKSDLKEIAIAVDARKNACMKNAFELWREGNRDSARAAFEQAAKLDVAWQQMNRELS